MRQLLERVVDPSGVGMPCIQYVHMGMPSTPSYLPSGPTLALSGLFRVADVAGPPSPLEPNLSHWPAKAVRFLLLGM